MPVASRPRGARWSRLRQHVLERDQWRCQRCRRQVFDYEGGGSFPDSAHVDHIRSLAVGGDPWSPRNCQALCRDCNLRKGARSVDYRWPARRNRIMLVLAAGWVGFMLVADRIWPG